MDVVRTQTKSRFNLRRALWALGGCVLLSALVGIAWPREGAAARRVERSGVWTERVKRGDLVRQVQAQGSLVPEHVRWLSAESAARVKRIAVRPGERVEPETVVVVLENSELELAALEAERAAASANSALIQIDVRTDIERRSHQTQLLGLRRDQQHAARSAGLVDKLQPNGLVSTQEASDTRDTASSLDEQLKSERALNKALSRGRRRQLAAQRSEGERLQQIAEFRRKQLAGLSVSAGISGIVQE